jgi:hypothetical protein
MRQVVSGDTIPQLEKNVSQRERAGWKRVSKNVLDDSGAGFSNIRWVCVMEMEDRKHTQKKTVWGNF